MLLSEHVVIHVVCRCYLQTSCPEFNIHVLILYHRNSAVSQWYDCELAFQLCVTLVFRVHTNSSITQYSFRTSSRDDNEVVFFYCITWFVNDEIFQVIQFRVYLFVYYLFIRQGSLTLRIPVHHAVTTVDESVCM